jgi:hypothetical protein
VSLARYRVNKQISQAEDNIRSSRKSECFLYCPSRSKVPSPCRDVTALQRGRQSRRFDPPGADPSQRNAGQS